MFTWSDDYEGLRRGVTMAGFTLFYFGWFGMLHPATRPDIIWAAGEVKARFQSAVHLDPRPSSLSRRTTIRLFVGPEHHSVP
ncbi:hypothetical protein AMAG_20161 [Allomyces macrogynus ATCC 38327]|uniref:Uncharacterized protein n=1 Tax=Allomyces macrogynus (strain ATCC 38327) TaxID=578462 RepID=A0A0L0T5F0_ALLM3|nr:hypothetical protein AMAG_20161 [Allomyces macrogynus ATCC 38327]|eukprot:KNE70013.1 hypothetical protein AMAG_20161 [Allomyces macrogynus ATCC 38327]